MIISNEDFVSKKNDDEKLARFSSKKEIMNFKIFEIERLNKRVNIKL